MRFLTSDIYKMTQISANIFCPKDEEYLKMAKEMYQGMDYDKKQRDYFMIMKPLMLEYFPEELKKYVYDESIIPLKVPSVEMWNRVENWKSSVLEMSKKSSKDYIENYNRIKKQLPENILKMEKDFHFHDSKVISVNKSKEDEVKIQLNSGGFMAQGLYTITFTGVKSFELLNDIIGDIWLYNEIHLCENGKFYFQVLLWPTNEFIHCHEFGIVADDVLVEYKNNN